MCATRVGGQRFSPGRAPGARRISARRVRRLCQPGFEVHLLSLGLSRPRLAAGRGARFRHRPQSPGGHRARSWLRNGARGGRPVRSCSFGPLVGVDISSWPCCGRRPGRDFTPSSSRPTFWTCWPTGRAALGPRAGVGRALLFRPARSGVRCRASAPHAGRAVRLLLRGDGAQSGWTRTRHPAAWSLGPQARYAHSHDYVVRCAHDAGFLIVEQSCEVLRRGDGGGGHGVRDGARTRPA